MMQTKINIPDILLNINDFPSVRVPIQDMMYPQTYFKVMVFARSAQRTDKSEKLGHNRDQHI
jgi:hypothetical protein